MIERVGFPAYNNPLVGVPNFWRNLLCDTPAPLPDPPPFTGGQCPGVLYRVPWVANFRRNSDGQVFNQSGTFLNVLGTVGEQQGTAGSQTVVVITSPDGVPRTTAGINEETNTILEQGITNITRMDNQPDVCGDPDPVYEELQPEDVTFDFDITFQNSSNVETTIPVTIIYARAQVLALGVVVIPFTLQLSPTVAFNGSVSLDGTVNIYTAPTGGGSSPKDPRKSPCGDIPLPDGEVPEDPTDSDQDPEPDRDREKVIKGVLVTVNSVENIRASVITQDENPDIYAPSLGFVNFLVRVGTISSGWTGDIPVKNRRHLIQCPWDDGALEVRGTPQPGVVWTLTPVFGYAGQPVEYVQ